MDTSFLTSIDPRLSLLNSRLLVKKPLFLARAAFYWVRTCLFRQQLFRGVMFSTHYTCNFNCRHCYEKRFLDNPQPPLTLDEKKVIIEQCLDLGILSLDFIGGESHLDPDFEELILAARPHRTYLTLATNGYGFDRNKIVRMRDMGIDKFNISIDSWDPIVHDRFRRHADAHRHAMRTLVLCRQLGMETTVSVVIFKHYTKDRNFLALVDFAIKNKIRLACKLAVPLGNWLDCTEHLVTKEDIQTIHELHQKHPDITRDIYGNRQGGCPAMKDFFTITAYGDLLPCNAMHISFGNLREESLDSVLKKAKKVRLLTDTYKGCHSAENEPFIQSILFRANQASPYPIKAEEVFGDLGAQCSNNQVTQD